MMAGDLSPMTVGINLDAATYYSTAPMFVDAMKSATDGWWVVQKASLENPWSISGVSQPQMDPDGYPIGLGDLTTKGYALSTSAFLHNGKRFPAGSYTLLFDGDGTVVVHQGGNSVTTVNQEGGAGRANPVDVFQSDLGIIVSIVRSNPSDYVRNIRLVMPGFADTYQSQPFNPAYLEGLQSFNVLRFMDTMRTNDQSVQHWSDRTTLTDRTQTAAAGVAVEYMVQMANTLHKDMWVNMPYMAEDDYVQGFAQYTKEHLDPGLRVYVEYGNEDWNYAPGFYKGYKFIDGYAASHGLSHDQATADLAKQDWDIWRIVFGTQSGRVQRVVANQFAVPSKLDAMISRLVATSDPTDADRGFEIVSGAPYFGPNSSGYTAATTVQDIVADGLMAAKTIGPALDRFLDVRTTWEKTLGRDIPVIMYEGGWGLTAKPSDPWYQAYIQAQTDPGMDQVTRTYLDTLDSHGVDGLIYYSYARPADQFGEWGTMEYLGQPGAQTPKFNALSEYNSIVTPTISKVVVSERSASAVTISWTTSVPSSSQVEYGSGSVYDRYSPLNPTPVTLHSVRLTGLDLDATYHFRVTSTTENGRSSSSADLTFSTDVIAPVQAAIGPAHIQGTSVTISWTTSEPSFGRIDYAAANEGIRSSAESIPSTNHSIILAGLAPGTLYTYSVSSADLAGNSSSSNSLGVRTAAVANPLSGTQLTHVGTSPTSIAPSVVATQGRYAYVAGSTSPFNLQVFDISGGGAPALLSTVATGSNYPTAITVAGNYAYIVSIYNGGLLIYDVANPAAPKLVSRTDVGFHPHSVAIQGRYAYITHYDSAVSASTLAVYDISNPAKLVRLGSAAISPLSKSVVVDGSYAYVVGDGTPNFQVLDVSDPANPTRVGTLAANGYYEKDVVVQGRYAFVAYSYGGGGLQVIDIADPTRPVSVTKLATGSNPLSVQLNGHLAYLVGDTTKVIDITAPGSPRVVATYATRGSRSGLAGRSLLTINPVAASLDVADIGGEAITTMLDPLSGTQLTLVGTSPTSIAPSVVATQGRYAYVAGSTSPFNLQVFDISGGGAPALLSTVATGSNYPTAITVAGNYAYIVSIYNGGLLIYDVANSAAPKLVSRTDVGFHPHSVAIQGRYAYITHYDSAVSASTLAVYDISNPAKLVRLGSAAISPLSKSVVVDGSYAYVVGDGTPNFQIFDVSDPANPARVGTLATNGYFEKDVVVQGRYAFVAYSYGGGGLQVIDIADPTRPVSVAKLATGSNPLSVQLNGHLAYLVGDTTKVIDITDPGSPRVVATYATRGSRSGLAGRSLLTINPVAASLDVSDIGGEAFQSATFDRAHSRLFAIETSGRRILVFDTNSAGIPLGSPAYVLGLGSPGSSVSQTSVARAEELAYDATTGRLYVADSGNNRVLVFDTTRLATGMAAAFVLGQSGFSTSAASTTPSGLSGPDGMVVDAITGRLYVADSGNNRVLIFDTTRLATGMAAAFVLGQTDFAQKAPGSASNRLNAPGALALDSPGGRLFVADRNNDRLVTYRLSGLSNGMAASDILGGSPATSGFASLCLNAPSGLDYDPVGNRLLVTFGGTILAIAAPVNISNLRVETSKSGTATIRWATDALANTRVEYGPTTEYGLTSPLLLEPTRDHTVTLTGLKSGVTYHFRVHSYDTNLSLDVSLDIAFTMP